MAAKDNSNLIVPGAIAAVVLMFGNKLMKGFSFFGNDAQDQANQAVINQVTASNVFSPNYYKTVSGAMLTTVAYADGLCKAIYDAKGLFNDDEAAIYGAFSVLKYKTQVSWLAERFYKNYQKSLLGFLQDFLNESEMAKVATIVSKLK